MINQCLFWFDGNVFFGFAPPGDNVGSLTNWFDGEPLFIVPRETVRSGDFFFFM
jgi:hypothetical protein